MDVSRMTTGKFPLECSEVEIRGVILDSIEAIPPAGASKRIQIVADELGLSPDRVLVTDPDTDIGGFDGGSQGSRTTQVAGRAALDAAREVRNKVLDAAAELLQAAPGELRPSLAVGGHMGRDLGHHVGAHLV